MAVVGWGRAWWVILSLQRGFVVGKGESLERDFTAVLSAGGVRCPTGPEKRHVTTNEPTFTYQTRPAFN